MGEAAPLIQAGFRQLGGRDRLRPGQNGSMFLTVMDDTEVLPPTCLAPPMSGSCFWPAYVSARPSLLQPSRVRSWFNKSSSVRSSRRGVIETYPRPIAQRSVPSSTCSTGTTVYQ